MTLFRKFLHNCRGNIAIIAGLGILPLMFGIGSAIDFTRANHTETVLRDALNSAAIAAAMAQGKSNSQRRQIARDVFAANIANMSFYDSISVPYVVITGSTVHVVATIDVPTTFLKIAHIETLKVREAAAAMLMAGSDVCVLSLDDDGDKAMFWHGTGTFEAADCTVQANSSANDGMKSVGNQIPVAKEFCHGGGYTGGQYSSTPKKCTPNLDPFAYLEAIDDAYDESQPCKENNLKLNKKTVTLEPGRYCGGIRIQTHSDVTLLPGIYVVEGDFQLKSHSTVVGDGGVVLVLKGDDAGIDVQSGTELTLTAPVDGDYAGLIIHQVKDSNAGNLSKLNGGGAMQLTGSVHLPDQELMITGGGDFQMKSASVAFVAWKLEFGGNGSTRIEIDTSIVTDPPEQTKVNQTARLLY